MESKNEPSSRAENDSLPTNEATILQRLISELNALPSDSRRRMIDTVCTFFNLDRSPHRPETVQTSSLTAPSNASSQFKFSEGEAPTSKKFMIDKAPATDIDRVACLAYYLTHFRSMPHFKTKDISELNTEAAQRRFSNAAFAVVNATNSGFLVPSVKGCKQLSALGEQYVQALPDQDAANETFERLKWRKTNKRSRNKVGSSAQG